MEYTFLQKITKKESFTFKYSICTLVTRLEEYQEMAASFLTAGFNTDQCEFLYVDNSSANYADAYTGINMFLSHAKGQYIILCHQDILMNKDNMEDLDQLLTELQQKDENWAICGNAGAAGPNHVIYHISYPNDIFKHKGEFPTKVSALDENFLVVKKSAMLAQSNNLSGFHLYATDLCLNAEMRGFSAYAIAFNLTHKSYGNADFTFHESRKRLIKKYDHFFRSRWIQTNSTVFYLSGSWFGKLFGNPLSLFIVRMRNGIRKKRK